ncbi:MAG: C39 family peptidase [Calditrichia bacterium]
MKTTKWYPVLVFCVLTFFLLPAINLLFADHYPDQFFVLQGDSLYAMIESSFGIRLSDDGRRLVLDDNATSGYAILTAEYSQFPFNRGLPSWNGSVADENSGFMIQMRFPYGNGWSPWLTAGFWKAYIWDSHGSTSYGDGEIDYDYVKLSSYQQGWQFKIMMQRNSTAQSSPTLSKLSFFISDSRTTAEADYTAILNDNPAAIMIPTDFFYQYAIDDQIGGSICSPTTVSMILRSYEIPVDPLQFARDTRDPYYGIFGIWPRVVQNASEYGLDGAVTRYRSWSEAREVLAKGGRIGMSVSYPLYSGHLMMLAGFADDGTPLVHDPARQDGYAHRFNKSDLSHSWFDKGGIGYTFYLTQSF